MSDFNGHNPLWGGNPRDTEGKRIEDLVDGHALCMLNDGSYTYMYTAYGTYSAINLSIVQPVDGLFVEGLERPLQE